MINPPAPKVTDPRFEGREWRNIQIGELLNGEDVAWAQLDSDFETVTKALIDRSSPGVILLRDKETDKSPCDVYDYTDLNAYLLVILGLVKPEADQAELFHLLVSQSQERSPVLLRDVLALAKKPPLVTLPENASLSKAIEIFGGGCHRIVVCRNDGTEVVGLLSQLNLLQFMWLHGANFPIIHQLYSIPLRDLNIGTHSAISINGDRPLGEALILMTSKGLTSVAVVDNALNVVGNISIEDSHLLTRASSIPLIKDSCIHFVSVALAERGIRDGKDSFPVFHVSPNSSLSSTVQKLLATGSHRMWLVESASPSPSAPSTPSGNFPILAHHLGTSPASPSFPSVSAAALPGANISGRLTGVVSLTDVLNLFAKQSGLNPLSPHDERSRRRRSSSISLRQGVEAGRVVIPETSADMRANRKA